MKQVLFIIGIILMSVTANAQPVYKTITLQPETVNYLAGPIDHANLVDTSKVNLFETPDNNYQTWGVAYFASDSVIIEFRNKQTKRANRVSYKQGKTYIFDMAVKEVSHKYYKQENKTVSSFVFVPENEYIPIRGELVQTNNRWEIYLYFTGKEDAYYYSGSTFLSGDLKDKFSIGQ